MSDEGGVCEGCGGPKPRANGRYCSRQCMTEYGRKARIIWRAYVGVDFTPEQARALDRAFPDQVPYIAITNRGEECIRNAQGVLVRVDFSELDRKSRWQGRG